MDTIKLMIQEAIQLIEQTTNLFYQQKKEEGYKILEKTLTVISLTVIQILDYNSKGQKLIFDESKFNIELSKALQALEKKDLILVSDILKYEIEDMFEECIKEILKNEP